MLEVKDTAEHLGARRENVFDAAAATHAKTMALDCSALIVQIGARVHCAPRVSVVIPAFGVAAFVCETLESVFAQTFSAYEVLLVNDGSPDTTELEREIEPFLDRLVYIKQSNGGAAKARNAGVAHARGELIAFLDGDDVWLPEFLSEQIEFLKQNHLEMTYADALMFGDNAHNGETYMQTSHSIGAVTPVSLIGWTCNVITSGTIIYKNTLVAAGLFDESPSWKRAQDFDMWFRVARNNARIGYQTKVLLKYRVRRGSLTGNPIDQAVRNIAVLDGIKAKYDLTPAELAVWQQQKLVAAAIWQVESGKAALKSRDFSAARKHFRCAAPVYSRPKIWLLTIGLLVAPDFVRRRIEDYNFER